MDLRKSREEQALTDSASLLPTLHPLEGASQGLWYLTGPGARIQTEVQQTPCFRESTAFSEEMGVEAPFLWVPGEQYKEGSVLRGGMKGPELRSCYLHYLSPNAWVTG